MSQVTIRKAKITGELFLQGEYDQELAGHANQNNKFDCTVPVHDDLKAAITAMDKHLAILCSQVPTPTREEFKDFQPIGFNTRSFTISNNDSITISGGMDGAYGNVNLNTPSMKLASADYPFMSELNLELSVVVQEVEEYLFKGKRAPEKQIAMDFGGEDSEDQQPAAEVKKKKEGTSKGKLKAVPPAGEDLQE